MSFGSEQLTLDLAMVIGSVGIGLVFLYAAATKLLDLPGFVAGIRGYGIVPARIAPAVAGGLIAGEGLIGGAHVLNVALPLAVPATMVLLAIFFVTVANLLWRGDRRPCLCFGAGRHDSVDGFSLLRIGVLLAVEIALFAYLIEGRSAVGGDVGITGPLIATLSVLLAAWLLVIPSVYRVWRVIRS